MSIFGVDSLILSHHVKGNCPTGSGWSPKKTPSYVSLDFVFFGWNERKPIFGFSWSKNLTFFQISFWVVFFNNNHGFSKKNERTSHPNIFFSSHNMLSFQKEMHKKPLMFCSTYLRTFLPCFMFEVWDQILIHRVRFLFFDFFGGYKNSSINLRAVN